MVRMIVGCDHRTSRGCKMASNRRISSEDRTARQRITTITRLLLAKRDEGSTADEAATPVPAADEPGGDLIDRASADSEADLQVCVHHSRPHLLRAIEDALSRIRREHSACVTPANNRFRELGSKRFRGRAGAEIARISGALSSRNDDTP